MASITAGKAEVTAGKARTPKCARCRNHGYVVQLKGHSGKCQFRQCLCWKCSLIKERTKILASQRRIKSVQGSESPGADGETVTAGSNGARPESVTRDRSGGDAHTVHCEPKTPAGARAPGDLPPFPGEYISFPGQMYPPEMFSIPLPLQPHFPDRCMFPAVLVSLRPPAPGAFREHVGFVPLPHGALSHPLETRDWQIHVPQYSPYFPYPGLRDEHSHYSLCHMNGEQGRSEVPLPATNVPESQVEGNQETVENLSSRNTP